MIDSWDDLTTVRILGERVKDDTGYHTNRYEKPIEHPPTPFMVYKEHSGNQCPFCKSHDITGGNFHADDMIAWRYVDCKACQRSWKEEFDMINIVEV